MSATTDTPNIGEMLAPFLARIPEDHVPIFLALAERRAAERYREWATRATSDEVRGQLLACSAREEEIARRVEALVDDPRPMQATVTQAIPELPDLISAAFDGQPLREQFTLQASGERLGAATWRSLAAKATDAATRDALPACAELEEQSAEVLEALLAAPTWSFDGP